MSFARVRRVAVSWAVAAVALAAFGCDSGDGAPDDGVSRPFDEGDCRTVAQAASEHDDPVRRRQAVIDFVKGQGLDDAAYRELAETCVRLRCPGPSPAPVTPNPRSAPLPLEHGDLGPDAPWPCATGDIV